MAPYLGTIPIPNPIANPIPNLRGLAMAALSYGGPSAWCCCLWTRSLCRWYWSHVTRI